MNINIRTSECAWSNTEVVILGRKVRGLRGFSLRKSVDKEPLYGAGQTALDVQEGNIRCEGDVKLLGFEVDYLNRTAVEAGFSDITEVPHEAIALTIKMQKSPVDPKTTFSVRGVSFQETGVSMEQGDKMREVSLPFIAMDIIQTFN